MSHAVGNQRAFYFIVLTQTLSLIASRMVSISVGIWLFQTTGNTTPLLLTAFFTELPPMLIGSVAGVWIDRWDRRHVLMIADAGQAVGSVLLLISFLSGHFQIWHLYAIALLQGSFALFQGPAKDAATTVLIPEQHRERANAVQQMSFPLAGVIAPFLAGMLYLLVGLPGIIIFDLATFLIAVTAVYLVRIPPPPPSVEGMAGRGNVWREMISGYQYLARRRLLLALVLYMTFINFLLNGPLELGIPYLVSVTGSEQTMGLLLAVSSLGAFSGATLIAIWGGTRPRMHTMMPGLLLTGAMFILYGIARTPLLLGLSLFFLMAPLPIMGIMFMSILQVKVPPDLQGRMFALVAQLGYLASTTSFLLTGILVDQILEPAAKGPAWRMVERFIGRAPGASISLVLVVTGLIILVTTLIVYLLPSMRRLEILLPDYEAVATR
jgi:MFS family permease